MPNNNPCKREGQGYFQARKESNNRKCSQQQQKQQNQQLRNQPQQNNQNQQLRNQPQQQQQNLQQKQHNVTARGQLF